MNESIFEDTFFGNGSIAGTPADEDVEELIDIPEAMMSHLPKAIHPVVIFSSCSRV